MTEQTTAVDLITPESRNSVSKARTVAVIQSNYIPWKGYFDIINDADLFVFYDDVQYTKNDWRNRNLIKTPAGVEWITIPVGKDEHRLICEVQIRDDSWARRHWTTLQRHYHDAPHFNRYKPFFEDVYLGRKWDNLSTLNQYLTKVIAREFLGISTEFVDSRVFRPQGCRLGRLLDLLERVCATSYISGPSAKAYIDPQIFAERQIELRWKDYSDYPEYFQLYPPFVHQVTILDLLFNVGADASWYIWGHRRGAADRELPCGNDGGC